MDKIFKEVKDIHNCLIPIEATQEEYNEQLANYREGKPHFHIFHHDVYAASGWYKRTCIICGKIDLL